MSKKPHWPGWRAAGRTLVGSNLSTRNLATGVALGALVAPTPLLGLHTWMAIGLAFLFRVNRLAAFIGSNIANPFTMAFLVWLDIRIGARLLGRPAPSWPGREWDWRYLEALYSEAWIGALVLGPVLMIAAYGAATVLLGRARRRRSQA